MNTKLIVSLAAALTLMIFVPTGAGAVGAGKTCGGFFGQIAVRVSCVSSSQARAAGST
jgi:hypothetical protein